MLPDNSLEVAFPDNPDALAFINKLFCFAVLGTLFMSGQPPDILIADYEQSRVLRYSGFHVASCVGGSDRSIVTRHRQGPSKYQDFSKQRPLNIRVRNVFGCVNGLANADKPLLNAKSRLPDCKHEDLACTPRIF